MQPQSETRFFRASGLFAFIVLLLFALHQDFWLRDDSTLVAGLPIGLLYHVGYCLVVSVVLGLFLSGRKR